MSSKEIMLNIVVEEFKDENIHIMTNGSVTGSCVPRAHLMSSGCSWAYGTWSWSGPKVPPDLHKVWAQAPPYPVCNSGAAPCCLLMHSHAHMAVCAGSLTCCSLCLIPAQGWAAEVLLTHDLYRFLSIFYGFLANKTTGKMCRMKFTSHIWNSRTLEYNVII